MEIKINPARANNSRVYTPSIPNLHLNSPAHDAFFWAYMEDGLAFIYIDKKTTV